jgi:hypothetical protein
MIAPGSPAAGYEIRMEGLLDRLWGWSGSMQVDGDGAHAGISGLLPDQPAPHGVVAKIRVGFDVG